LQRALAQHAAYCLALRECGLEVTVLPPDERFPDGTFVEDTAVVAERAAVSSRPGAPTRQGEAPAIAARLGLLRSDIEHIKVPGTLDGGDVCQVDEHFLIGLSARQFPGVTEFARQLQDRIAALGRAHNFVRPHGEDSAPTMGPSTLRALLTELLNPYPALDEGRLTIEVDDLPIDDRAATPIGLVFHELATNAAKYGALSMPDGRVRLASAVHGDKVRLTWEEQGGPPVPGPPESLGFGSRLTEMSIVRQLGGTIEREWSRDGLRVVIEISKSALSRP